MLTKALSTVNWQDMERRMLGASELFRQNLSVRLYTLLFLRHYLLAVDEVFYHIYAIALSQLLTIAIFTDIWHIYAHICTYSPIFAHYCIFTHGGTI